MSLSARACGVILLALALAGCPSNGGGDGQVEENPAVDVFRRDVGPDAPDAEDITPPMDSADVALDAPDTAMDVATVEAADAVDAFDVADVPETFFGFDGNPDVFMPGPCDMPGAPPVCSSDADCTAMSERCLSTGCGTTLRCQPAGRACADATDCMAGTQSCVRGVCVATGADCGDTRACPLGFVCEGAAGSRTCVDRRHHCDGIGYNSCPWGATCYASAGIFNFCVPIATRCTHDTPCILGARCRDIDGDGLTECVWDGCTHGDCTAGSTAPLCSEFPLEAISHCEAHGICSSAAPCLSGWSCVDTWGTGVRECHPNADPCQRESDCTGFRQLCYSSDPGADADLVGHCDGP